MISGDLAVGGTYREHAVQGVCGDARGALFSWRLFFILFLMFSRGRRTSGFGEETRAVEVIRVTAGGVFWCKSTPTRTRHVHATRARYTSVLVSCFFLPSILCEYFLAVLFFLF